MESPQMPSYKRPEIFFNVYSVKDSLDLKMGMIKVKWAT